jgi:methionyl-tRNA formyltransferase
VETVIFLGTSAFAVPTLQGLVERGYPIAAVITQPNKPSGRGQSFKAPPVKEKAQELNLKTYQPAKLKDDETRSLFQGLHPDLLVVVAYGKILPPWLIELPQYGVVNLHGSLLPKYRGAAPIQWAVANGETETGVCTMQIDAGLDTGPVYLCEKTAIGPNETADELSERLAIIGVDLMTRTIDGIKAGTLRPTAQADSRATVAPILRREDGYIDWNEPAQAIHNRIRAFNPWPGVVADFRGMVCKFLKSRMDTMEQQPERAVSTSADNAPGTILANRKSLSVVCGEGTLLQVLELQLPNRKPVRAQDFVNGMRIQPGEKFARVADNGGPG